MSDKELSGEEKRRLMKEKFKRELRDRQEFLKKVKNLKQQKKITGAMTEMASSMDMDDTDEWIRKLDEEAAFSEAKSEMAMEMALEKAKSDEEDAFTEEEMRKITAESMVEQLKKEIAEEEAAQAAATGDGEAAEEAETEKEEPRTPGRKTLGDLEF